MMNYVGSVSILDRGDAPAQAILDKNARSLAQRVADETKEELEKVMNRVETIYESYEQSTQALYESHSSLEYVEDIAELEALLKDQVKKKKYQQQVTIFVVGYENVCGQRLKLLQQVNEFFMDNSKSYEEEDWYPGTPDVDLDDVSQKIEDSLETAGELAKRLGELNQEMVDWLSNYAITKASNKGKKKLEKALTQAKDDLSGLNEKLLGVQTELEEKDEKLQNMLKNLEMKSSEVQKFKTAADVAKARLGDLQRQVDNNKAITEEQKRDLLKLHEKQLLDLHHSHNKDIEDIKNQHAEELKTAQEEIEKVRERLVQAETLAQSASEEADLMRQSLLELQLRASSAGSKPVITDTDGEDLEESRPSTKDTKSSRQSVTNKPSVRTQPSKAPQKLPTKTELKSQSKPGKETSEIAIQDEGGDHTSAQVEEVKKQAKKSKSTLETVQENETGEYQDEFDLKDNDAWANIPSQQLSGRFLQYRKLTVKKLEEIEEQLNLTTVKTQRKVQTLKSQFQEHKGKWEAERKVLVEQISQAQKMQTEAEKEADAAMSQLEDFINEQERLENEEENKRQEVANEINSSAHVRKLSIETPKTEQEKSVPQTPVTREPSSDIHTQSPPQLIQSEDSENELRRLMQQTDDAKAQEMKSRHASGAMSAPPAVEPVGEGTTDDEAFREKGRSETMPVTGLNDDEVRVASAKSRASLRSQYRNKLEEARSAAEDRRSKSPAISVPSVRSLEEDQLVEEEEEEEFPVTDELKVDIKEKERESTMDVGTSPPPTKEHRRSISMSRQSLAIADHPAVQEYLKIYGGLVSFRDALSKIMVDKEMLQFGQILADLDTVRFEKEAQVYPQLERMTTNVYYLLEEMTEMLSSLLIADREPVVSSMMMLSRDPSQKTLLGRESGESGRVPPQSVTGRYSTQPGQTSFEDKEAIRELQIHCDDLQHQLIEESRKHEEQLKHNTVVMMEMQDTINELQRELAALGRASSRMRTVSDTVPGQVPDSAIMFTRLDSERNSKIMKRAVNDDKLDAEKYKDAVNKMDDYVSLPAQRLAHLVRKYVHHCRMKEIEENVKKSRSLNENVFEILDKMEALQNQRAKKWADKMDEMGSERLRLASLLMETLDSIEQESGIFLIKPMYSYRSRDMVKERYAGKLSRPNRPRTNQSPARDIPSAYAPAPTPASNVRGGYKHHTLPQPVPPEQLAIRNTTDPVRPLEGDDAGVMGASLNWTGTSPRPVWNLNSSQVRGESDVHGLNLSNTPRILELDINRMLIGQNTISSKLQQPGLTEDRLVNASQNNLRSYVTVNRPTASPSQHRNRAITSKDSVPPSSPAQYSPTGSAQKRVRLSDAEFSRNLTNTPPLPPIPTGSAGSRHSPESDREQTSPPGSSLRHSPTTNVIEVISPLK